MLLVLVWAWVEDKSLQPAKIAIFKLFDGQLKCKRLRKSNFHGPIDLNDAQLPILFVLDNEEKLAKFIIQMTAQKFLFRLAFTIPDFWMFPGYLFRVGKSQFVASFSVTFAGKNSQERIDRTFFPLLIFQWLQLQIKQFLVCTFLIVRCGGLFQFISRGHKNLSLSRFV